jgi:hypothetical protein
LSSDHHDITLHHDTVLELHRQAAPLGSADIGHADPGSQVHPVGTVQRTAVGPYKRAQHVGQGDLHRLDHGDPAPQAGAGRRHLGTDEPGTDDNDPARVDRGHRRPQSQRVVQRAQGEQPIAFMQPLGPRKLPRRRSGGEHQGVARHNRAVVKLDLSPADVEADGALAEHFMHPQFTASPAIGQDGLLGGPCACQYLLGQRGPVVRQVQFLAYQGDAAIEAFGTQRLHGAPAGQRSADHHHGAVGR